MNVNKYIREKRKQKRKEKRVIRRVYRFVKKLSFSNLLPITIGHYRIYDGPSTMNSISIIIKDKDADRNIKISMTFQLSVFINYEFIDDVIDFYEFVRKYKF